MSNEELYKILLEKFGEEKMKIFLEIESYKLSLEEDEKEDYDAYFWKNKSVELLIH